MTKATAVRPSSPPNTAPGIHYQVAIREPENHLFEVTLWVRNWQAPFLDLKMPVWTPGSYLVREYSKHLQDFKASTTRQRPLSVRKLSKNHWQVETLNVSEVEVSYRIYANELTVRTNHIDETHGYFNGAALFFYIPGFERQPIRVSTISPRADWQTVTPLPQVLEQANTFEAEDFDTLVDSPFEIGLHQLYEFEVQGLPHQLAIWGRGNAQAERLIPDIKKIIEVEAQMFGELPYERYLFLLHLAATGGGGLEHKNACTLNYYRFGFRAKEQYDRFMQLVAHEFFHLWNVKRIRPKALEVFDYTRENYTPSLWFCEGTTSYYDLLIPLRAGIYDAKAFLNGLSKQITRFMAIPGRLVQPLSQSSFDAWIKLYRPDANSNNSQISYYLKGELVSLLLDLLIRARHENSFSLDDVMRQMWQQFGKTEVGFTPEQLQGVIESVAGINLDDFFARYIDGTDELPFEQYLAAFGLQLIGVKEEPLPYLGLMVQTENGRELIKFVEAGSPAQVGGIDAGDELLAIDGFRVKAEHLSDRLYNYESGHTIQVTVFHQDELRTRFITLADPRPSSYKVVPIEQIDDNQNATWLRG